MSNDALESIVRRVMIRVAMADGELHHTEIDRLRWNIGRVAGQIPTEEQVTTDVTELQKAVVPLGQLLTQARRELDIEGRRALVRAAYLIASADGDVPPAEETLVLEIARGLGVSPAEFRQLVSPMALARVLDEH